jgi:hypothetical protein
MIKKVLLVITALVAGLLIFVATRPDTYHIERSTKVEAPAEVVFATVSDFKTFNEWSPWAKRDPNMKLTVSTPSTGVGATYAWEGNKEVGKGRMTFTEHRAPTRVRERLEFLEPFPSTAETGFDIAPAGASAVTITWSMDGRNNFVGKAFGVFMDMDEMIGKDFEEGLAGIKRVSEAKHAAAATAAAPPAEPAKEPAAAPAPAAAAPAAPAKK